jgi:hypothetical protein
MKSETMEKSKEYLEREKHWNTAFAITKTGLPDGEPSELLLELVEKEKRGEITEDEIMEILINEYTVRGSVATDETRRPICV